MLRVIWAPVLVVVAHALGSRFFGHRTSLDPAFHFLGGVAGAVAASKAYVLFPWIGGAMPPSIGQTAFAIAAVCAAALVWETGEFLSDVFFRTRVQMGRLNTLSDIALGVAGGALGAFTARARSAR